MKNIRLGTWNVKECSIDSSKTDQIVDSVVEILKEKYLDVLTLQDMHPVLIDVLKEKLKEEKMNYGISYATKDAFGSIKNLSVEYNVIISNLTTTSICDITYLPKYFSLSKPSSLFQRRKTITSQMFDNDGDAFVLSTSNLVDCTQKGFVKQVNNVVSELSLTQGYIDTIFVADLEQKLYYKNFNFFYDSFSKLGFRIFRNFPSKNSNELVNVVMVPEQWVIGNVQKVFMSSNNDISSRPLVMNMEKVLKRD